MRERESSGTMGGREGGGRDGESARESTRQREGSSEGKSAEQVACQGLAHDYPYDMCALARSERASGERARTGRREE